MRSVLALGVATLCCVASTSCGSTSDDSSSSPQAGQTGSAGSHHQVDGGAGGAPDGVAGSSDESAGGSVDHAGSAGLPAGGAGGEGGSAGGASAGAGGQAEPDTGGSVGQSAGNGGGGAAAVHSYPAAPYGTSVGAVIADHCFQGLRDPKSVDYVVAGNAGPICFRDFYNPKGLSTSARVLLVATAALWCSPCKDEEKTAQTNRDYWLAHGAEFMTLITEDATTAPATLSNVGTWAKQFKLGFPVALDADKSSFAYFSAEGYPDHLLIDLVTMKIIASESGTFDSSANSTALIAATAQ